MTIGRRIIAKIVNIDEEINNEVFFLDLMLVKEIPWGPYISCQLLSFMIVLFICFDDFEKSSTVIICVNHKEIDGCPNFINLLFLKFNDDPIITPISIIKEILILRKFGVKNIW